jgi:exodeoxyribonuclease VII small subunit
MSDGANDISGLSFEQALGELETIVAKLERGDAALEDAIGLYERGAALKALCEQKLSDARLRVEQVVLAGDGSPSALEPAKVS